MILTINSAGAGLAICLLDTFEQKCYTIIVIFFRAIYMIWR